VPPEGKPVWFGRGQDANGARRTAYLKPENIIGYPDHYVQSTERHPMDYLAGILNDKGWGGKRIGVEMDNYWFSAKAFASLQQHLPNARFSDATALVNWQRAVKSPAEIGYMRNAARIVEAMHQRIFDTIEVGMRKCDLVAEIYDAGTRGVDGPDGRIGGDYPAIVPLLPSGADASAPHLTWDDNEGGRGHLRRNRRLLSSLSLPAVAYGLPWASDASLPRCREGDSGGDGGGAGGRKAR
jgi:ectoine hydrolase